MLQPSKMMKAFAKKTKSIIPHEEQTHIPFRKVTNIQRTEAFVVEKERIVRSHSQLPFLGGGRGCSVTPNRD